MAIAAAQPNDEVDIAAATYTDTCEITVAGLTLKGVGGQPKIDLTGMTPAQSKGIYIVTADNTDDKEKKGTIFRTRSEIPGLAVPKAKFS